MSTPRRQQNEEDLRRLVTDFQRLAITRRDDRHANRSAARDAQEAGAAERESQEERDAANQRRLDSYRLETPISRDSFESPSQYIAAVEAQLAAEQSARNERTVRRQASRDAAEAETRRIQNEPLRMAMLRAEQDNARQEQALARNRAQEENRLLEQAHAAAIAAHAAERRAARDERNRWDDDQARRADEDRARRQRLVDDLSEDRALRRRIALIAQQNRQRDLRAERRDVPLPEEPDVPLPPPIRIASRVADGFAAALDWMRRRAEAQNEQLIRDNQDVPDDRDDEWQKCIGCYENKRAVIALPCGHCVQCNACWRDWKHRCALNGEPHTCPQCRAPVQNTAKITQEQLDALSTDNVVVRPRHAGSWAPRVPAGPIFMNAEMPGGPLASMHSLLDASSP